MLTIAICDDEPQFCDLLSEKLSSIMSVLDESYSISCYNHAVDFQKTNKDFDIVFLDIQMPVINGLEIAKFLRRNAYSGALIFITTFQEYMFEVFEFDAIDYLCKPVDDLKLQKSIKRARNKIKMKQEYGTIILKCHLFQSVSVAALLISILYICNCITSAMGFWIAKEFAMGREYLFHYLNLILAVILLILLIAFHAVIIKFFYNSLQYLHNKIMLLLSGQILFIGIAEQMVLSVVYGDTIIWDMEQGLLLPIVNSAEIFILQFFACIGLISVLVTYRQLVKAIQTEQTVKLLEQQTNEQVTYVKEAQIREQQTRSFKHDIRNHFLLLHELLKKGQTTDALDYLSDLEDVTNTLTCQCRTGNSIIDTLLNSKFTIAAQKGIQTTCEISIPSSTDIKDIDWCILLSNAIDNAIHASECVETENRYLHINGAQKGNFFLLTIENRCLKDTQNKFQEGIGISNIRAVVLNHDHRLSRWFALRL